MTSLYPEWQAEAQCLGKSDVLFFGASEPEVRPPYTLGDIKRARAICQQCPVAKECLRAALINREEYGVWAGTTRKQRRAVLQLIDSGQTTVERVIEAFEAAHE